MARRDGKGRDSRPWFVLGFLLLFFVSSFAILRGDLDGLTGVSGSGPEYATVSAGGLSPDAVPKYRAEFDAAIDNHCPREPKSVAAAKVWVESGWDADAYNTGSGAAGLGQIMPREQRAYGVDADGSGQFDRFSPADSLATSARIFCMKLDAVELYLADGRVQGNPIELALSAYNAGEGKVLEAGGIYGPTAGYVRKVMDRSATYVVAAPNPSLGAPGIVTVDGSSTRNFCPAGGRFFVDVSKEKGQIGLCDMGKYTVNANLAPFVANLFSDAASAGVPLTVTSSYRDSAAQEATYRRNCGGGSCRVPTARPGTSEHELGLAIDFGCAGRGMTRASACFEWLIATGGGPGSPKGTTNIYGLRNFPAEAWHFSPTGSWVFFFFGGSSWLLQSRSKDRRRESSLLLLPWRAS